MGITTLSDLLPSGVAFLSTAIALLSAWRQFRSSLPDKELSVEILSDISLPFIKEQQNEIATSTPLTKQMRVISVRVRNTGREDIRSSDYIEPIRLAFKEPILSSSLIEIKGAMLSAPLGPDIDQGAVILPAIQLHPKSFMTVNTLLSGSESSITVKGLIEGGQIVMANPTSRSPL